MNDRDTVEITLAGHAGAGKTRLLHEIGAFLKTRGVNVSCFDENEDVQPVAINWPFDDRRIIIKTEGKTE